MGITSGDRIVTINGFPPAGGASASFLMLQRDPDRNGVTIQLERGGIRMERATRRSLSDRPRAPFGARPNHSLLMGRS